MGKIMKKRFGSLFLMFAILVSSSRVFSTDLWRGTIAYASEEKSVTVDGLSMYNDYIKFAIAQNGRFVIGTTGGDLSKDTDDNKKMLYAFPNAESSTSYTTFVVDGTTIRFGENGLEGTPVLKAEDKTGKAVQKIGNIEITQTLSIINNASTNKEDVVEIKYDVKNTDTLSHTVGSRIMLDTMLGDNDSAPFRIQDKGNFTVETEFTGDEIPQCWYAFDSLNSPKVISQGTFIRGNLLKPDKVQFANWGRLSNNAWNYNISSGRGNGDSAVAVIWNENELLPGESRTYKTYYGLNEMMQNLLPPLALSVYGDNTVTTDEDGTSYLPYNITTYIENIGNATANNAYVQIELPENMTISGGDQPAIVFEKIDVSKVEQVDWSIDVSENISEGTYPIKITCGANGIDEKVIIKNITVPKIDKTEDNKFFWGNETSTNRGDNFSFLNSTKDFFDSNALESTKKYNISDKYFSMLTKGLEQSDVQKYIDERERKWGGSCFGMSSVAALMKTGHLTPYKYTEGANSAYDLIKPKDSEDVESLVNFYQIAQGEIKYPNAEDISYFVSLPEQEKARELLTLTEEAEQSGMPIVLGMNWCQKDKTTKYRMSTLEERKTILKNDVWVAEDGRRIAFSEDEIETLDNNKITLSVSRLEESIPKASYNIRYEEDGNKIILEYNNNKIELYRISWVGHAVVAYALDEGDFIAENSNTYQYRVSIYDPNFSDCKYIYVSGDCKEWYYNEITFYKGERLMVNNIDGTEDKTIGAITSNEKLKNFINLEAEIDNKQLKDDKRRSIEDNNGTAFNISTETTSNDIIGLTTHENNGFNIVTDAAVTVDGEQTSTGRTVFLPEDLPEDEVYTIKNISGLGEMDYSMNIPNYLFVAKASNGEAVNIDPEGKIDIKGVDNDYTIGITFNEGSDLPWYTIRANGVNSSEASLELVSDGMILTSDNLNNVKTEANNTDDEVNLEFSTDMKSVKFMAVDDDTLGAYIDTNNDGIYETIIADSDGGVFNQEATAKPTIEPTEEPVVIPTTEPTLTPNSTPSAYPTIVLSDNLNNKTEIPNVKEIKDERVASSNSPNTGDSNYMHIYICMLLISTGVIIYMSKRYKKI